MFFDKPRIYRKNNKNILSFFVKDNFYTSAVTDDLLFTINNTEINEIGFSNLSIDNNYSSNYNLHGNIFSNLSNYSYEISDSILNKINIQYDKLISTSKIDTLKIGKGEEVSLVSFYALDPNFITNIDNRYFNPDSIENISITFESIPSDLTFNLEKVSTNQIINNELDYDIDNNNILINKFNFENIDSDLYYINTLSASNDTSSIIIKKPIVIDTDKPKIYTGNFSENFSIDPLPGKNNLNQGLDITDNDKIKFTVIEGPNYFNESFVLHDSTLTQTNLDMSYIFNNTISVSIECYLDNIQILDNNNFLLNYNQDFSAFFNFNNNLLNLSSNDTGELIYRITITDNAENMSAEDFKYTLQSENNVSINNFINYPNPFNTKNNEITIFRYSLPKNETSGKLILYDISGKLLYSQKLENNNLGVGTHMINWDGKINSGHKLGSGVYYAILDLSSRKSKILKVAIIND